MTPEEQDAALAELYAKVPDIPGCKGLCHNSCTVIEMSARERQVTREAGVEIMPHDEALKVHRVGGTGPVHRCEALDADNRCTIYEKRPLICRLFGTTQTHVGQGTGFLNCEFGCAPERPLTEPEVFDLLRQSFDIGGMPEHWEPRR